MIEKLKTICSVLLGLFLLPIFLGGSIPYSIKEYLIAWLGVIIFVIVILFFLYLSDSGNKKNESKYKDTKVTHSECTNVPNYKPSIKNKNTCNINAVSPKINNAHNITKKEICIKTKEVPIKTITAQKEKENFVTVEQKEALLKIAIDLCYCSPERFYLWKEQYEILLEFARTLSLKKDQLDTCIIEIAERIFRTSTDNINQDYYEIARTISQDEPFIQLINVCSKLLEFIDSLDEKLIESESYAYLVFPKILEEIGFTQKEIEDLKYGEGIYGTRDGKNIIVLQEQKESQTNVEQEYPVSKVQMTIFKKNWTLPQFRKEFGIEDRVESKKNHTWNEDYKVCIFIKNSDGSEFEVGFSNSLGEPSIEEIQRREKELMVGLSYYGNYKLYDNQIPVLENIDLGI